MHRSSSANRVSEDSSNRSPSPSHHSFRPESDSHTADQLPTYNPQSHVAKKERSRLRLAEAAVHLIPLLLILCGIVLWLFSSPAVDLVNKGDSIVARIEDLKVDKNTDDDGSSSFLSDLEPRDSKSAKQLADAVPQATRMMKG